MAALHCAPKGTQTAGEEAPGTGPSFPPARCLRALKGAPQEQVISLGLGAPLLAQVRHKGSDFDALVLKFCAQNKKPTKP